MTEGKGANNTDKIQREKTCKGINIPYGKEVRILYLRSLSTARHKFQIQATQSVDFYVYFFYFLTAGHLGSITASVCLFSLLFHLFKVIMMGVCGTDMGHDVYLGSIFFMYFSTFYLAAILRVRLGVCVYFVVFKSFIPRA